VAAPDRYSLPPVRRRLRSNTPCTAVGGKDLLRACFVKVRLKPFGVLGYAEDLSLIAPFGRNASKPEEAAPRKQLIEGCSPCKRSRFGFSKSNLITYQTGSQSPLKGLSSRRASASGPWDHKLCRQTKRLFRMPVWKTEMGTLWVLSTSRYIPRERSARMPARGLAPIYGVSSPLPRADRMASFGTKKYRQ
jgi:hypothetical protein